MSKLSSNTVKIVWQFARINALPPTRKCDVYVNNNSCSNLLWWDFNRMSSKLNYIIEQTDDENSAALYVFKVSVLLWNSVFYMRIHKNKIHYDNITHYWILDFFKICGFLVHKIQFHHKTNKNPLNRLKRVSIYEYIYIYNSTHIYKYPCNSIHYITLWPTRKTSLPYCSCTSYIIYTYNYLWRV